MSYEQKPPMSMQSPEVSQAPPQYPQSQDHNFLPQATYQTQPMEQTYTSTPPVQGVYQAPYQSPGSQPGSPPMQGTGYPQQQQQTYFAVQPQQFQQQQQQPMQQMPQQQIPQQQIPQQQFQTVIPIANLGSSPAPVQCPSCGQRAMTRTMFQAGNTTNAWALGLCLLLCVGCFAYLVDSLKDVVHNCGNCGVQLATWHRSGRTEQHLHA